IVRWAWGSRSMRQTVLPISARAAPRLTVVVVLPTPPFWFMRAMVRILSRLRAGVWAPVPLRPFDSIIDRSDSITSGRLRRRAPAWSASLCRLPLPFGERQEGVPVGPGHRVLALADPVAEPAVDQLARL